MHILNISGVIKRWQYKNSKQLLFNEISEENKFVIACN